MMTRWGGALDFLEWECRRTTRRVYGLLYNGDYRRSPGALKIIEEATEENKREHIHNVAIRLIHAMIEMRMEPQYYEPASDLLTIVYKRTYLPHLSRSRERYPPLYTDAEMLAGEEGEEVVESEEEHAWQSPYFSDYSDEDEDNVGPSSLQSPKYYFSSDEETEEDGASSSTAANKKRPRLRRMGAQIVPEGGTFADAVYLSEDDRQGEKKQRLQALIRQMMNI